MTRFKELERIDTALESGAQGDLEWAINYCESRIAISPSLRHERAWRQRLAKVRARLGATEDTLTRSGNRRR